MIDWLSCFRQPMRIVKHFTYGKQMSLYTEYLKEIEERKTQGLKAKPIDDSELTKEIISQIKDTKNEHRKDSLEFFIYNTLPGTTTAAIEKAKFLKEIIRIRECLRLVYSCPFFKGL